MKITLLTNHLNPGGITTYVLYLARGLKENGHIVKVFSRGGVGIEYLKKWGIEHIFINLFTKSEISPKIFFAKRKLLSIIKKERPDLLHSQTRITRVLAQFVSKKLKIPFVSTAHGFYKKRLSYRLFPYWGEKTIAISEAVKEDLMKRFNLKSEHIKVVYNGIDLAKFKPRQKNELEETRRKLRLGNGPIIGIISRVSEIKGHLYLIEAMNYVLKKFSQAQLLIIGEGDRKKNLVNLVRLKRLEKNIIFISSIDDTSLILPLMDVFVLPSLEEGLGIAILEAMASYVPVVATGVGGIPEIIKDGENGILVPPRDIFSLGKAVCNILENRELKNKFILNGRRTVEEKFDLRRMVKETAELYREVI